MNKKLTPSKRSSLKLLGGSSLVAWTTPVIQMVSLPAHATTSPVAELVFDTIVLIEGASVGVTSVSLKGFIQWEDMVLFYGAEVKVVIETDTDTISTSAIVGDGYPIADANSLAVEDVLVDNSTGNEISIMTSVNSPAYVCNKCVVVGVPGSYSPGVPGFAVIGC